MSKYSFSLKEPKDLLDKLGRDMVRFCEAAQHGSPNHEYQSDFAFNLAITSYHLIDWTWKWAESSAPDLMKRLACDSQNKFRSKVISECEAIRICRELANGAKHFRLDRKSVSPLVASTTAMVTQDSGVLRSVLRPALRPVFKPIMGYHEKTLFIKLSDGRTVSALSIFESAHEYWLAILAEPNEH